MLPNCCLTDQPACACLRAATALRAMVECRELGFNILTGAIPTEMGSLTSLTILCAHWRPRLLSALRTRIVAPLAHAVVEGWA